MLSLSTPSIWKIYVRFQNFPVQYILNCNQNNNIEKYYFHSLKQAIFVLHNSTRIFNELSIHQQQLLWFSIKNCNQQLYEDILKQSHFIPELLESFSSSALPSSSSLLLPSSTSSSSTENNYQQSEVISLPIRVLHDDKPTLQRPVRMNIVEQMLQIKTLRQVLSIDFNIHFYNNTTTTNNDDDEHNYERNDSSCDIYDDNNDNSCDNNDNHQHNDNNSYDQHYSGNSNRSYGIKNINNNTSSSSSSSSSSSNYNIKVIVHGIEVPLDAPICTLWLLMHHCDLWLYIIICSSSSSSRSNNIVIKP